MGQEERRKIRQGWKLGQLIAGGMILFGAYGAIHLYYGVDRSASPLINVSLGSGVFGLLLMAVSRSAHWMHEE